MCHREARYHTTVQCGIQDPTSHLCLYTLLYYIHLLNVSSEQNKIEIVTVDILLWPKLPAYIMDPNGPRSLLLVSPCASSLPPLRSHHLISQQQAFKDHKSWGLGPQIRADPEKYGIVIRRIQTRLTERRSDIKGLVSTILSLSLQYVTYCSQIMKSCSCRSMVPLNTIPPRLYTGSL